MEPFKYINPEDHPLCTFKEEEREEGLMFRIESEKEEDCCFEGDLEEVMAMFDADGVPYILTALVPPPEEYDDYNIHNHPSLSAAERNPTLR
jgi:hypothetical protein